MALPARELCRLAIEQVLEAEDARRLLHETLPLVRSDLARLQRELDVPPHRHVRVQRVALEDHGDVAVLRLDVVDLAVPDLDRAFGRLLEPGDHAERGRLAAAGRAEEHEELLVGHLEGEVVDRGHVAEPLRDSTDGDPAHDLLGCSARLVGREDRPAPTGRLGSGQRPPNVGYILCARPRVSGRGGTSRVGPSGEGPRSRRPLAAAAPGRRRQLRGPSRRRRALRRCVRRSSLHRPARP